MIDSKILVNEVQVEMDAIKEIATKEEIDKLDFDYFRHISTSMCIYGQMTGYCDSARAREIMGKSYGFESATLGNEKFKVGMSLTPLEVYLFKVDSKKHQEIIQYLKGEIDTIDLKI